MATRKVNRKSNRKNNSHNKSKHSKRKMRKVTRKKRRHQKRRSPRVVRGGGGSELPFHGAKSWNPETGGNVYTLNNQTTAIPESERFGNIAVTPSVYDNHGNPDVVMKDLPVPESSLQAGGRRRRRKTSRKKGRKGRRKMTRKGRRGRKYKHRSFMRGGKSGSTVCPSCPNTNNVGPASPSLSEFVPQAVKDVYRSAVDTIENTDNAFAGKAPIADNSDISDQPIAKGISSKPPQVNLPPDVGGIIKESQMSVARV